MVVSTFCEEISRKCLGLYVTGSMLVKDVLHIGHEFSRLACGVVWCGVVSCGLQVGIERVFLCLCRANVPILKCTLSRIRGHIYDKG